MIIRPGRRRRVTRALYSLLRRGDAEVPADLPGQMIVDLAVAGHGGAPVVRRIAPPRVLRPLADENASMLPQMGDQLVSLHVGMPTSSYGPKHDARASARFISSAS